MFVDERIYTLHAGQVPVFLKLYEEEGMECQVRILGRMVGYYYTDFGPLNQIVHMWGYESLDERHERRKALQASPEWQSYARQMRPWWCGSRTSSCCLRPSSRRSAGASLRPRPDLLNGTKKPAAPEGGRLVF